MPGEFFVARCYEVGGVGIILAGRVESGQVREGSIGRTFKGKKCTLVRIEKDGDQIPAAKEHDKVNLFVKHVTRADVKPGETLLFD